MMSHCILVCATSMLAYIIIRLVFGFRRLHPAGQMTYRGDVDPQTSPPVVAGSTDLRVPSPPRSTPSGAVMGPRPWCSVASVERAARRMDFEGGGDFSG